ncbi:hypothetical protein AB0O91_28010 [Kitasatospora sp. NPDC089797]|uniref:hypothetical protein n=1 Tax=Kitasatospora sp. NPDC089797 TaxID=3155298 RepID=UPI0034339231
MAHPLTLLRAAKGLSHPEYARLVAQTHVDLGFGQMAARREKVSRWESGRTVPEQTAQLAMAHLHGVPAREVRRLGWPFWLHLAISDTTLREQPYTVEGAELVLGSSLHLARAPRSPELLVRGTALTAQLRSALTQIAAGGGRSTGRGGTPSRAEQLAWIEARTEALEQHEAGTLVPAACLYRTAHAEHRLVIRLLGSRDREGPATGPLFHLAARTALLGSWLSGALGEETKAERHGLTALRAAAAVADPALASAAMIQIALRHLSLGSPADVLALGQAVRAAEPRPEQDTGTVLHCVEALALARLGNPTGAARALDRAAAGAATGSRMGAAAIERHLTVVRARAALLLGDPRGAKPHFVAFTDSLSAPRAAAPSPQTAAWLLSAVEAHLALGELDRAARAVHLAADIAGTLPPGLALQYRARLARHEREPVVREALERLEDLP